MELKNSFYQITAKEVESSAVSYEIQLDANHTIYKAHFPGEPVTPGVCIIQIAKELTEDHTGHSYEISGVKNVKFIAVISPLESPCVRYVFEKITPAEDGSGLKAQVRVESIDQATQFAKLSLSCTTKP